MTPLLDAPLAIVDVETTGAHPAWDRVTEIVVVEVVEEMRKRVEKELNEKELSITQFWKEEIEKLLKKPAESLGALHG